MSARGADVQAILLDLTKRLRPEARRVRAGIFLDLGGAGTWGFYLDSGRAAATADPPDDPDVVIRTSADVLEEVVTARRPGYEAFLAGDLEVRGNLSLALELESLFVPPRELPPDWPRTTHVRVGRVRWSILEAGPREGLPVLLVHGLGATKATFLSLVEPLCRDHRVLAVDLPGFGDSSKPIAPYDAAWFAERVLALLDHLEIKEVGIIGNSMGGRIGIELGLRSPERVRALALLAPALAFVRFRQLAGIVRLFRPQLAALPVSPPRAVCMRVIRGIFADPGCLPASWYEAAVDEFLRVWRSARGRMAFASAGRHIYLEEPHGEEGFWRRLGELEVPTQFVFGRQDPLVPPGFARHVADALPDARISLLDDCGHVPQLEAAETTLRLARGILA